MTGCAQEREQKMYLQDLIQEHDGDRSKEVFEKGNIEKWQKG
jgi:hypothetical protein